MDLKQLYDQLSSGFFSFWVKYWRVSVLVTFLVIAMGGLSLSSIPKESSPKIEFGIVMINTSYPGVSPVDIDRLITEEIEKSLEDIDGINKIQSASSVGFASTTVELENGADVNETITDIKSEIDKIQFPEDANDPIVTEISSDDQGMFELIIFGDQTLFPKEKLIESATIIKQEIEGTGGVTDIDISGSDEFDIEILVDKNKAQELGLSLAQIGQTIRAYNRNIPLGQYEVDDFSYDFRIQGELESAEDLLSIPIITQEYSIITIGDIARVVRRYKNDSIRQLGLYQSSGNNAISLIFHKKDGYSIFDASDQAKGIVDQLMNTQAFAGIEHVYAQDLSEIIRDDYNDLAKNGIVTLVCVLLCLFLFVGLKEAFIATLGIVLSFFVTFTVLDLIGSSLNFLTNFSLVLTLGIAIDTSIVVIEAAYERLKQGFTPKTAVMMAVRDFKAPLIAGTMTTIVVFIPMMVLPGIMGKFLAYIPITVFITLVAALFIALTINAALFYIFSKSKKRYINNEKAEQFITKDDLKILEAERAGKNARNEEHMSKKQRILESLNNWYENKLRGYIANRRTRLISISLPIILLLLSFFLLSPRIGFTLFPDGDNGRFDIKVTGQPGLIDEEMAKWGTYIQPILSEYEEIDHYIMSINNNVISLGVELLDLQERNALGLMNVFELESKINERLAFLQQEGLSVESVALAGGPPQSKPVALKLITQDNNAFSTLVASAKQTQEHMRTIEGLKNISISSKDTPGQFVYSFKYDVLKTLGLTPGELQGELAAALNGTQAGSIKFLYKDADIKVLYEQYSDVVSPSDVLSIVIPTKAGPVKAGDVLEYSVENAVAQITRDDGNITITIDADLEEGFSGKGPTLQNQLVAWAETYEFPEGVSYSAGGETQENADLIQATIRGFFIAFFLIFAILLLQFNSFRKPIVIMYSVFCALLGVNVGLFLTGNPYSMPFAIGFIALTGIVVNDAIVFVDRVVTNRSHDIDDKEAIIEAGRSRLQPIILTTLTTLLGVLPLALQDEFWSGLGFTIIFGLFAGSAMTLFIIPSLYYEIIVVEELTWFKILFWFIVLPPYGLYLLIKKIKLSRSRSE